MASMTMTCLTCNVAFEDVDLGRIHYKTDWHRYNLKRKVANLTSVTLEQFQERLKLQEKKTVHDQHETLLCKPCNKSFGSTNSFENHMQSKKHKEVVTSEVSKGKKVHKNQEPTRNVKSAKKEESKTGATVEEEAMSTDDEGDDDVESWDSYDENSLGNEECLFCSRISLSLEDNLKHMTVQHSFFIPDADFVSDLEALITYLGEKVGAGRVCLWCNEKGKRFHSTKDVQRHMLDKGHCKIFHEGEAVLEFADFYDYSSSYPDAASGTNTDEAVNLMELDDDGYSLTLPSGATIGHRSLVRYYQQNMVPYTKDHKSVVLPKMLAHYKALGWTGSTGSQVEIRARDLKFMQNIRKKHFTQLGVKANKLRHRFRDQNP